MPPEMDRAGHLFASKEGDGKKFLLIGHLDTVFESDDEFQAFTRDGNIGRGPGIILRNLYQCFYLLYLQIALVTLNLLSKLDQFQIFDQCH